MMCARCVSAVRTEITELLGDLLVGVAEREQPQNLVLALAEPAVVGQLAPQTPPPPLGPPSSGLT